MAMLSLEMIADIQEIARKHEAERQAAFARDAWSEQDWEDAISEGRARLDEAPRDMQMLLTGRDPTV